MTLLHLLRPWLFTFGAGFLVFLVGLHLQHEEKKMREAKREAERAKREAEIAATSNVFYQNLLEMGRWGQPSGATGTTFETLGDLGSSPPPSSAQQKQPRLAGLN